MKKELTFFLFFLLYVYPRNLFVHNWTTGRFLGKIAFCQDFCQENVKNLTHRYGVKTMFLAYKYTTGEVIAAARTICELSELTNVSRQTIGTHIIKNRNRDLHPVVYAGSICFIDNKNTDIMPKPHTSTDTPDNNPADEIIHVYKLSTGEYICPCTAKALAAKLDIKPIAGVIKSIDRYGLKKHNIFLSRTAAEELPSPCSVYEIYTKDLNLVLSTYWPKKYTHWKPSSAQYTPNPYKPNHYLVVLPEDYTTPPNTPVIDYNNNIDNILLDNPTNV